MELGDTPDVIHPDRKQKLETGDHPLGSHPALSVERQNALASDAYKQTMAQVHRYSGRMPRSQRDMQRGAVEMFQTLGQIRQREEAHKEELEKLSIETVLRMPEFSSLRELIRQKKFRLEAHLEGAQLARAEFEPPSEEDEIKTPEFEVPEIKAELDDAVTKRRFINAMVTGAAVSNNFAFAYYAQDELNQIDPALVRDYGKLMAFTELGYWVQGDEVVQAAAGAHGSEAQGGSEEFTHDEDGPVVVARGLTFPILVHELVKGIMEFLSFDDHDDPETRKYTHNKADFLKEETWQMFLGPGIWKKFLEACGGDAQDVVPHLYDKVIQMPNSQFNALMQGVVEGTPQAKATLKQMAAKVRSEVGPQEESDAKRIARNLLDG